MSLVLEVAEHIDAQGIFVLARSRFPLSIIHVPQDLGFKESQLVALLHLCCKRVLWPI